MRNVVRVQISALVGLSYIPPMFYRPLMGERRIWPAAFRSIGVMIEHDVITRARCTKCQNFFDVDLHPLQEKWGCAFSLINHTLTCKVTNCRGTGYFAAATSIDAPLITLLDGGNDPLQLAGLTPRDIEPPAPPEGHQAQLSIAI